MGCLLDDILTYWSEDTRNRIIVHPFSSGVYDIELVHSGVGDDVLPIMRESIAGAHAMMRAAGYWRLMNDPTERMSSDQLVQWLGVYIATNIDGIHEDRIAQLNAEINTRAEAAILRLYRTI